MPCLRNVWVSLTADFAKEIVVFAFEATLAKNPIQGHCYKIRLGYNTSTFNLDSCHSLLGRASHFMAPVHSISLTDPVMSLSFKGISKSKFRRQHNHAGMPFITSLAKNWLAIITGWQRVLEKWQWVLYQSDIALPFYVADQSFRVVRWPTIVDKNRLGKESLPNSLVLFLFMT